MKTLSAHCKNRQRRRAVLEQLETRMLLTLDIEMPYPVFPPDAPEAADSSAAVVSNTAGESTSAIAAAAPAFNLAQSLSDQAQLTTLAFDGLALMTGNLDAQSFFPPGKVADYTGFQYLRDNDPDRMGHNTSFLTRVANNVIYTLNDSQLSQLQTLATAQLSQFELYAYKRYPLMQSFRRLMDGDLPAGSSGLSLDAVKAASRDLYLVDGQLSFDRALLYAGIINSMTTSQKAYLDAMKGKGFNSWPNITDDQVRSKMQSLPPGTGQLVMTYASDLFSWYAGSVDADVYFCPERHGTYYGGFYIKDAPAVGHEGYNISEQLTATAGAALCDASKGYVTPSQAATIAGLLNLQKNNLYAGATNVVQTRTQIAMLLRSLLTSTASSEAVKTQVLALSATYGDLDGENNYHYANVFAQVYKTLTADQKTKLAALRKSILSGTYSDGTPFDYTVCTTPFLYSSVITDTGVLSPYIANTDYLFGSTTSTFSLTSDVGVDGGTLPIEYTADGSGASPALSWSNVPAGAKEFALMMTTLPGDGTTKWNWVLYGIPGTTTGLLKNTTVGTGGQSSDIVMGYAPPQSQGPGAKLYTFTLYALSASPSLPIGGQVTGDVLTNAIASITLGSTSLNLSHTRTAPVAGFTYATKPGGLVDFTDASGKSTSSWLWDFGDRATSTAQSPSHTYAAAGTYTIKLTATNAFGSNTASQTVAVGDVPHPTWPRDNPGVYVPSSSAFFLRNSQTAGPGDDAFVFGVTGRGWLPLCGDWNGDGVDTAGVYDGAGSVFSLKNSHAGGRADVSFCFGVGGLGWVPLAGDWNADGGDTVGLYDPARSVFFLRNRHGGGDADEVFNFGLGGLGWIPIAGDWDGDGRDTVGLYDPARSLFFLKNRLSGGAADYVFLFGVGGMNWRPLGGDWDGDRSDTAGLYDPSRSTFFLRNQHGGGQADAMFCFGVGDLGWQPVTGCWQATGSAAAAAFAAPAAVPLTAPSESEALGRTAQAVAAAEQMLALPDESNLDLLAVDLLRKRTKLRR